MLLVTFARKKAFNFMSRRILLCLLLVLVVWSFLRPQSTNFCVTPPHLAAKAKQTIWNIEDILELLHLPSVASEASFLIIFQRLKNQKRKKNQPSSVRNKRKLFPLWSHSRSNKIIICLERTEGNNEGTEGCIFRSGGVYIFYSTNFHPFLLMPPLELKIVISAQVSNK